MKMKRKDKISLKDIDICIKFCIAADKNGEKRLEFPVTLVNNVCTLAILFLYKNPCKYHISSVENLTSCVIDGSDSFCIYCMTDALYCARKTLTDKKNDNR